MKILTKLWLGFGILSILLMNILIHPLNIKILDYMYCVAFILSTLICGICFTIDIYQEIKNGKY